MSTHIQHAIAELDQQIVTLTDLRAKLQAFQQEWPHTAASMTPAARRDDIAPSPRRKNIKRKKSVEKRRTDGRTDGRSKDRASAQRGASLTTRKARLSLCSNSTAR